MTWVKVCGLRTVEDVEAAEGADAVGLVIHSESVRHLDPAMAAQLAERSATVDPDMERVLVTRNSPAEQVLAWASQIGATMVQPHGDHQEEIASAADGLGLGVILPGAVTTDDSGWIQMIDNPQPGSGTLVDWSVIDPHAVSRRWILAGGLSPDNVAGAIEQLKPWGVDASSGLESAPGVKDRELLQSFIVNAKQAGAP